MDMSMRKISLIRWLTELNDVSVINRIEQIRNIQAQTPISSEELKKRHLQSEDDISNNNLIEQSQLQKFFRNQVNA